MQSQIHSGPVRDPWSDLLCAGRSLANLQQARLWQWPPPRRAEIQLGAERERLIRSIRAEIDRSVPLVSRQTKELVAAVVEGRRRPGPSPLQKKPPRRAR